MMHFISVADRQKDTVKNQKKRQKELSTQSITSALVTSCCPKRCLNKFYLSQMLDRKKLFLDMCPGQQRHFIRDSIRKGEGENGLNFFVEGKEVCEEAWKVLYGVKDTRYCSFNTCIHICIYMYILFIQNQKNYFCVIHKFAIV